MLYAKCIMGSQIANSKEEFISRQNEEHHVYCIGETTESHNGMPVLDCVPLNFIYDCLKYGRYIAIIGYDDGEDYIKKGSYLGLHKSCERQFVTNIIDSYSKAAIDFVFNEVKKSELIQDGYVHQLPQELQDYFNSLKK